MMVYDALEDKWYPITVSQEQFQMAEDYYSLQPEGYSPNKCLYAAVRDGVNAMFFSYDKTKVENWLDNCVSSLDKQRFEIKRFYESE